MESPETRADVVVEELHGERIEDPYRWLEGGDEDVESWTERQNEYVDAVLDDDVRESLRPSFEPLAEVPSFGAVTPRGGRAFQTVREADQERPVLTLRGEDGERSVLVDPNEWEGETSMDWFAPSPDGERVAYGVAAGGNEQYDLRVAAVPSGEVLYEVEGVGRTNPGMFAWADDGFYYVATGGVGEQMEKELRHETLAGDRTVVATHDDRHVWPGLDAHRGELVVGFSEMSGGTELAVRDGDSFVTVFDGGDAAADVTFAGDDVYVRTEKDAPRGRVLRAAADAFLAGDPDFETVVPEGEGVVRDVAVSDSHLVVHEHRDAHSHLAVYDRAGGYEYDVALPDYVSVDGLDADSDAAECYYRVQSFGTPATVTRCDLDSEVTETLDRPDVGMDVDVDVTQELVESTDGARVPVFVAHAREVTPDEETPAVLSAYGGFRINRTPAFSRFRLPFLADGGVYVQVCARGGSEFGEEWHEAGMRARKQHTFDDVIAGAEHVVEEGYTSPDHLGVVGGSNGGLMAGAVLTQRPDLWGAVVSAVPLLDMLRFHEFLLGESWTVEYGHPDVEAEFDYIRDYSPYHNVADREYPPTLFTTAVGDSRVHPSHARKMAARMQNEARGGPFLCRTKTDTGHGTGKSMSMAVEEQLDQWTFLSQFLD